MPGSPAAHTQQKVQVNVDKEFASLLVGSKGPPIKKGKNFRATPGADGKTQKLSFEAPGHSNYDGTGRQGKTDQKHTAYKIDGASINGNQYSTYVLPAARGRGWYSDKDKRWKTDGNEGQPSAEGPFAKHGVTGLDIAEITTPTGGSSFAVLGDVGPFWNIGEISPKAAANMNINEAMKAGKQGTWGPNNGFEMVGGKGLQYDMFPGSGDRVRALIAEKKKLGKPLTDEDIQRLGKQIKAERAGGGGVPIVEGVDSVRVGKKQLPAANVAKSAHLGGCPLAQGSETVSIEGKPFSRIGDKCTCGMAVVSGEATVVVGGAPSAEAKKPKEAPGAGTAKAAKALPATLAKNLGRGASGAPVMAIQKKLGLPQTGTFGPLTDAAVRAFQGQNGLTKDGVVGPETWGALFR
jgi:uncharacterized Zn-binding protein involved in type VI secretion